MQTPKSMTMLSFGSVGSPVTLLQQYLNLLPSQLLQLVEDGVFGSKTKARVQEFQSDRYLPPDAVVGPLTWDELIKALGGPQWPLRFHIVNTAVQDSFGNDVFAKKPAGKDPSDPRGRVLRMGYQKLLKYFRTSAPSLKDPNRSATNEDAIKYLAHVGSIHPMPSWCGIFALWAIKTAIQTFPTVGPMPKVGTWPPPERNTGISSVTGIHKVSLPLPGDVGYIHKPSQHHFIVHWVWPVGKNVKIWTIEGNSLPDSNFKVDLRNKEEVTTWYSIFPRGR